MSLKLISNLAKALAAAGCGSKCAPIGDGSGFYERVAFAPPAEGHVPSPQRAGWRFQNLVRDFTGECRRENWDFFGVSVRTRSKHDEPGRSQYAHHFRHGRIKAGPARRRTKTPPQRETEHEN